MKKLSFKNLNLKVEDVLQRKELKTVFGGYGGGGSGGGSGGGGANYNCSVNTTCPSGCLSTYHADGATVCSNCCNGG